MENFFEFYCGSDCWNERQKKMMARMMLGKNMAIEALSDVAGMFS